MAGRNKAITIERTKIVADIPKDVYADFRAAVSRRGRSGAFVLGRLTEWYAQLNDAEELEFITKTEPAPEAVGGGR
ncbi:MAG: hypothetical protein IKW13_01560 [Thermoguttaceae bacterium]|nr:hypothetical protein [Thermoguttaceae bacterium]